IVRFEVSSSAAIESAVSGFRVRRSTWMIWNSRSARLMAILFLERDPEKWEPVFRKDHAQTKQGGSPMLTACWQQGAAITGQHFNSRGFVHDDSLWLRRFPAVLARPDLGLGAFDFRPLHPRLFALG